MAKTKPIKKKERDLFAEDWTTDQRLEEIETNQEMIRNGLSEVMGYFNQYHEKCSEFNQLQIRLLQRIEIHSTILRKDLERKGKLK